MNSRALIIFSTASCITFTSPHLASASTLDSLTPLFSTALARVSAGAPGNPGPGECVLGVYARNGWNNSCTSDVTPVGVPVNINPKIPIDQGVAGAKIEGNGDSAFGYIGVDGGKPSFKLGAQSTNVGSGTLINARGFIVAEELKPKKLIAEGRPLEVKRFEYVVSVDGSLSIGPRVSTKGDMGLSAEFNSEFALTGLYAYGDAGHRKLSASVTGSVTGTKNVPTAEDWDQNQFGYGWFRDPSWFLKASLNDTYDGAKEQYYEATVKFDGKRLFVPGEITKGYDTGFLWSYALQTGVGANGAVSLAKADFGNTISIEGIKLFDSADNDITANFRFQDALTGETLFDQNDAIAPVPLPLPALMLPTALLALIGKRAWGRGRRKDRHAAMTALPL